MSWSSALYVGQVVRERLVPKHHRFAYRVFALCLDLDEIDAVDRGCRLFSRGRFNVLSFHDRDHGDGSGEPVAARTRRLLEAAGLGEFGARIQLVCYPRLFGYVFNPLSVYFCHGPEGRLGAIVYEVSNTFRERKCYIVRVEEDGEGLVVAQACAKEMYVSPFTAAEGRYGFRIAPPEARVLIGVNFHEGRQAVLKTWFSGERRPLDDRAILGVMLRHPLMTLKVMAAIHLEAARLWFKGVPIVPRHTSPPFSFTLVPTATRDPRHAE